MRQRLLLHLGLHKTATTYLQRDIWPKWECVGYAGRPTPHGVASAEKAVFSLRNPVLLMSNESSGGSLKQSYLRGKSWLKFQNEKLETLRQMYEESYDIGVLIGLRNPRSWIMSIYKHYLKYGGVETIDGFLGIEKNSIATLNLEDLKFMPKLNSIKRTLNTLPFCFFIEEIRENPKNLSSSMAEYAGVKHGPLFTSDSRVNEGVNQAEATFCLRINRALVNRNCLGRGYIKRNKTIAFDLARKYYSLGMSHKNNNPLLTSPNALEWINLHLREDFYETIDFIASHRKTNVKKLYDILNF